MKNPSTCTRLIRVLFLAGLATPLIGLQVRAQVESGTAPPAAAADASSSTPAANGPIPVEQVTKLDAITGTSDIGTYHEVTSEMASKVATDLKDLASSLQVLNQNAIADRNANNLQDVFVYLTGVTQSQTNINGFTFRGLPVSGSYDQNIEYDGLMGTPLKKGAQSAADVSSLEFLKGPNSVLYGQMHPGGLMNIVSKNPLSDPQIDFRATVFSYDGAFNPLGNVNGDSFSIDATGPVDAGKHLLFRVIADVENTPPSRPGDFDKLESFFPALTYNFTNKTYFTIKLESDADYRRQDDGVFPVFTSPAILSPVSTTKTAAYGRTATYYFAPFNTVYQNTYDRARDKGDALSTLFHTEIGRWTVRVQTRSVWHADWTQEDTDNSTNVFFPKASYATPNTTIERQYNLIINGHRWNSFDANTFAVYGPESFESTLIGGVGGGVEQFDNQRYAFGPVTTPAVTIINPIINQPLANGQLYPANGTAVQNTNNWSTTFGEYFSDQMKIADFIHVSYGIRHDQYVQAGIDLLNPVKTPYESEIIHAFDQQLGVVFDLTKSLAVYSSWSQSTTPNTVTDINAQGQSGFAPEKGTQYENGLKVETRDHKFYGTLCYFYIDRTNVLVSSGQTLPVTGQAIYRLDGAQHSQGTEIELQYQPIANWQFQAGAAFEKAFIAESITNPYSIGDDLANAPRATGNLWTRYNFSRAPLKGLGVGLGAIYVGKYWAGDPTTVTYFTIPGYTRVDTALYYKWQRYNFALNIQNVGDRRFIQSEQTAEYLVPGEQRKITLSVERKF